MREKFIIINQTDSKITLEGNPIDANDSFEIKGTIALERIVQSTSVRDALENSTITIDRYLDNILVDTYNESNSTDIFVARLADITENIAAIDLSLYTPISRTINGHPLSSNVTITFNSLSPMTASGDIIYGGTSGTATRLAKGTDGHVLTLASGVPSWAAVSAGTVTTVSVTTANGVSGSVATATSTPAITLTLGAITPTSVTATGAGTFRDNVFVSGVANVSDARVTITRGNSSKASWFEFDTGGSSTQWLFGQAGGETLFSINYWDGAADHLYQTISTSGDFTFSGPGIFTATNTATSGSVYGLKILPIYNQASGTAANTDLLINRTQTAVGSGAQNLIDAQVAGTSRFKVDNTGTVTTVATGTSATSMTFTDGGATSNIIYKNLGAGQIRMQFLLPSEGSGVSDGVVLFVHPASWGLYDYENKPFGLGINGSQVLSITGSAMTSTVNIDAPTFSAAGTPGFTGTGTYSSFTIVGGIITNAS